MAGDGFLEVSTDDGRTLEVLTGGDPEGFPWVFHSDSPSAAVAYFRIDEAAARLGLRMVTYSGAGYGSSPPRPIPEAGPRYADDVADVVAILDHLEYDRFVTMG